MKNRLFLLANSLIISASVGAQEGTPLDELMPEQLFSYAQKTYEENDCVSTTSLLSMYLKKTTPSSEQRTKILNVIGWCAVYMKVGSVLEVMSGCCDPSSSSVEKYIEN